MQENSDNQIALFVRDERTGRRAFNAQAEHRQSQDSHSRKGKNCILFLNMTSEQPQAMPPIPHTQLPSK